MTTAGTVQTIAGLVPVAMATEAALMPAAETWSERLGVAAVLVVAGYFLLRWFMAQSEKKDAVLLQVVQEHNSHVAKLTETHAAAQREANALLVRELERLTNVIEARE